MSALVCREGQAGRWCWEDLIVMLRLTKWNKNDYYLNSDIVNVFILIPGHIRMGNVQVTVLKLWKI